MTRKTNDESPTQLNERSNVLQFKNIHLAYGDRVILDNISGEVSSKKILALMGPSGSGKSSLLNVLSFRWESLGKTKANGYISINNVPLSKKDRYKIGYVIQEDTFFPTLTLYETLTFYVNLRMPKKYTKNQKDHIIEELTDHMQLQKCMNTVMGGGLIRGLSGGERKRASVACELITNPLILMLDEPTSGLDSYMASNVINILKTYCVERNIIVIASIHQPSSQTFHNFDNVMLLTCGKLAYKGPTEKIAQFFSGCGFECPTEWNIADYILDVIGSNEEAIDTVVNKFKDVTHNNDQLDINTNDTSLLSNIENDISPDKIKKWPAGIKIQFMTLLRRSFLLAIEDTLSILNISKTIIISLILGMIWFQIEWNVSNLQNILGLLYYSNVESFSTPFFGSVFVFSSEKEIISRERMGSMYGLILYYITKIISEIPSLMVRPIIYSIIIYPMAGLQSGPTFLIFFAILILCSMLGESYGLFISSLGLRQKETLAIMVIIFILLELFGGFFNTNIPSWLSWGRYLSPFYQLYVLQVYSQMNYQGITCDISTATVECPQQSSNSTVPVGKILEIIQADIQIYWFIIIPIAMMLFLNFITFFILRRTVTKAASGFSICEVCNVTNLWTTKYSKHTGDDANSAPC